MFGFSRSFAITTMPHAYPNFLNKGNNPLRIQMPNCFNYPSIFVDVGENLIMVDDVVTPSNPPIALVEQEKLKETSFDVNVFQWSRKKKSFRIVVCIRINRSAWDR